MTKRPKICSTCKTEQPLKNFHKYYNSPDGHTHRCKLCVSRKKITPADRKTCHCCNNEKPIEDFGKRKNGKFGKLSVCKKCLNEKASQYRKQNIEHIRKIKNEWRNRRRQIDPLYRLECNMRCRIYDFLNGRHMKKNNATFNIIGCSPKDLKQYLENKFTNGMCWENYGYNGWHVDHIIPLDSAQTENEIYQLCHYSNLQPLWKQDNFDKGYKII